MDTTSRRTFLQHTGLCLTIPTSSRLAASLEERPLLRFLQINDLHVQAEEPRPAKRTYEKANAKARWLVEAINRGALGPAPDFVVGVGDVIHGEALDRLKPDLDTFREIIRPLKYPFYPVVGNHEVVQQERSPQFLKAYRTIFGQDREDYTFQHAGVRFVALNNSGAPNKAAARLRNDWLKQTLNRHADEPKIVFCHIPLVPLRDKQTLARSFGFRSYMDHDPGTLSLIEAHARTTIAVLSGHLHLTGICVHKGIAQVCLSGTASYPCDAAILYTVYPRRIEAVVKTLPNELVTRNNIHGPPRHKQDFTDKAHAKPDEYYRGGVQERTIRIELPLAKQPQSGSKG